MTPQYARIVLISGMVSMIMWLLSFIAIETYVAMCGNKLSGALALAFLLWGVFAAFEMLISFPDGISPSDE